ncbi:MAG: hypothetical protein IT381_23025 [Deltaproteobacteria bacterium]|nr:hypothetical protein [Deltaproteobacteria bacterium]
MSDLAAALRAHFGRDLPIDRVIASEDVFKQSIVLTPDRAVVVEDRLGSLVVKGDYPYAGADGAEVREGFLGKEVHLRTAGGSVRLQKLRADDAAEIVRRFGGNASVAAAPPMSEAPATPIAPSRPQPPPEERPAPPSYPVTPPRATATAAAPPFDLKNTLVKAAQTAALIALVCFIIYRIIPYYGGMFWFVLASLGTWTATAMFGAWPFHRDRMGAMARFGLGAGAFVAFCNFAMRYIGLYQLISFVQAATAWAIISVGYFTLRGSKVPLDRAAAVGAAFGVVEWLILPHVIPNFFGAYTEYGASAFAIFLNAWLFWSAQYWLERAPTSPLKG